MAAKKNLPVADMFAEPPQLDGANELRGFERLANIVRRSFCVISNQQRAPAYEKVHPFLLGEGFIRRLTGFCRRLDERVVTWPERKFVNQILRFHQVTRRMPRPFHAFVSQVEGDLGSTMTFVGNQK